MRRPVAILLLVASVLIHWPLGVAEFSFDDRDFIQVNVSIRSVSGAWHALLAPFPPNQPDRALYRPLVNLSYAIDYAFSGEEALGYHRTNVVLYLAVVLLVYQLAFRYTSSLNLAFAVALLFSVHPVHCDAVDAIAGRSELLALLFGLASILLFLRAVRDTRGPGWALTGSLVAFALACLSKETGAVLPGALAFHVLLYHPPRRSVDRERRARALRYLAPFFAVLVGYLLLRFAALGRFSPEITILSGEPSSVRLLTLGVVFFEYLRLLVYPRVLQIDYYYHDTIGLPDQLSGPSLLGLSALTLCLALLAVLLVRHLRTGPSDADEDGGPPDHRVVAILSLAIFLIFLLPVAHILDIGALLAERFLLAPSLGFVLLIVLAGWGLLCRLVGDSRRRMLDATLLLCAMTVIGGWRSAVRAGEWRDSVRLWTAAASAVPWDARVQSNLGLAYFDRAELELAQAAFERALSLDPQHLAALGNLGSIQLQREDSEAAIVTFQQFIAREPENFIAWNNLGVAEAQLQRHSVALEYYARSLELNPNYAPARENLGESQQMVAEATRLLQEHGEAATSSQDSALLRYFATACTIVGDRSCAERFASLAARFEGR